LWAAQLELGISSCPYIGAEYQFRVITKVSGPPEKIREETISDIQKQETQAASNSISNHRMLPEIP